MCHICSKKHLNSYLSLHKAGVKKLAIKFESNIFEVFFRKKPAMILVSLRKGGRNRYSSVLAKEVDCTYSHAVKILQEMEKAKLVSFEKHGRNKTKKITGFGKKNCEKN